jgi:hypothetical protein
MLAVINVPAFIALRLVYALAKITLSWWVLKNRKKYFPFKKHHFKQFLQSSTTIVTELKIR